jgi:transcription initiation factor TFIIIB Brf1 subunit/transcription initiation factor TFIIB
MHMSDSRGRDTGEGQLLDVVRELEVPESTFQITQVRLNRLGAELDFEADQLHDVVPAVLALSCREDGLPVTDEAIVDAWNDRLEEAGVDHAVDADDLPERIDDVASRLGVETTPPQPTTLIEHYGTELDLFPEVISAARQLLDDAFDAEPTVVAGGTSPGATAGAVLSLAAWINDVDGYGPDDVADVTDARTVTITNRYREFQQLLEESKLEPPEQYRVDGDDVDLSTIDDPPAGEVSTAESSPDSETDSSGKSDAPALAPGACVDVIRDLFPDDLPTTERIADTVEYPVSDVRASLEHAVEAGDLESKHVGATIVWMPAEREQLDTDLTIDAVQADVDALAAELDVDPTVRLFARGLVSDAVDDVAIEDATELAAAAVLASSRVQGDALDPSTVAAERDFETRVLFRWLDSLAAAVDVSIPQRDPADVVETLVETLELSDAVREESYQTLDQYQSSTTEVTYAPPELAAGAVFFAAIAVREPIDVEALGDSIGFDPAHVSEAMNGVFVSLCLDLLGGDLAYDECSWTADLLEADQFPDVEDAETSTVFGLTKTYIAGREGEHVDDATLEALVSEDP